MNLILSSSTLSADGVPNVNTLTHAHGHSLRSDIPPIVPQSSRPRHLQYALTHLRIEYQTLCWQTRRVLTLARHYPASPTGATVNADQSVVLEAFADRLSHVHTLLLEVLTPAMRASIAREEAAFEAMMAQHEQQQTPRKRAAISAK